MLSGARPIQRSARAGARRDRFARENEAFTDAAVRAGAYRRSSHRQPTRFCYFAVAVAAVHRKRGASTPARSRRGETVALINYLLNMLTALLVVANLFVIFTKSAASAKRVTAVLEAADTSPEIYEVV